MLQHWQTYYELTLTSSPCPLSVIEKYVRIGKYNLKLKKKKIFIAFCYVVECYREYALMSNGNEGLDREVDFTANV